LAVRLKISELVGIRKLLFNIALIDMLHFATILGNSDTQNAESFGSLVVNFFKEFFLFTVRLKLDDSIA